MRHTPSWRTHNQIIQTSVSSEVNAQAAAILAEMGLTVSDVISMLLTKIAQEKSLPSELFCPNETTIAAMKEAQADGLPRVSSVNKFFEAMNADDWAEYCVDNGV